MYKIPGGIWADQVLQLIDTIFINQEDTYKIR